MNSINDIPISLIIINQNYEYVLKSKILGKKYMETLNVLQYFSIQIHFDFWKSKFLEM